MKPARLSRLACLALVGAAVAARPAAAAILADSAADVCASTVHPCVITQSVEVVSGSVLDFGTRAVEVRGSGQIDVGSGTGRIRAGGFSVTVSGVGLKLNDGAFGGLLTIEAYRRCSANPPLRCLTTQACAAVAAGTCSVGSGAVALAGKTVGNGEYPGTLVVRAAGDVAVSQRIQMNGNTLLADGGGVDLEAAGVLAVSGAIEANAGGEGAGGEIVLSAGTDLRVGASVDALGGDFDGGTIELFAGRDILITAGVSASASTGEGFGGSIEADAGRNIEVVGGTALNNLVLGTDGHTGYDGAAAFAGDGGLQGYTAGGSITFSPFVKLRSNGAIPDGSGDEISIVADGPITLRGSIEARSRGTQGAGGLVDIAGEDAVTLASTSSIDVAGSESGGGDVYVFGRGDVTAAGAIEVAASNGGIGGSADLESEQSLAISGTVHNGGARAGTLVGRFRLRGCRIDITAGGSVGNQADAGVNSFFVADRMTVAAGASVSAAANGKNVIERRTAAVPPLILGAMTPAPVNIVNPALPSCPLCGNGVVNLGETCDDGNVSGGDGCSVECQLDTCVAATPGYPGVALCNDGNPCTADRCDPTVGGCVHVTSCDDGFACTVDECSGGECVHTPMDALCDDNNPCTSQSCGAAFGCTIVGVSGACDDEVYCNGADACLAGACALHTGDPCDGLAECLDYCDEGTDTCRAPFGHPCSSDGNPCTDDVCSGVGGCMHVPNSAPCDDGAYCNGPDFCVSGACTLHAGDPCDPSRACAHTCDEGANLCSAPMGEACADDGNVCTDDVCDGSGGCAHLANSGDCEDGDFCTLSDRCAAGVCVATDGASFSRAQVSAARKGGEADDRLSLKARAVLDDLSYSPLLEGVTLSLRDAVGREILNAHLPASAMFDAGGRGTTFKFRDAKGTVASAGGVASATVKHVARSGEARVTIKARGIDLPPLEGLEAVSVSLLVGTDASAGDCVSVRSLPCAASASRLRCRN